MGTVEEFFEGEQKPAEDIVKPAAKKKTEATPAHPEPEPEGDDFQLTGEPDMKELVATLEEYRSIDGIPAAALKDIDAALSRNETDIKVLSALIEKVKSALNA
jgi:hypothetical protein